MIHQCLIHKADIALPSGLFILVGRFFLNVSGVLFCKIDEQWGVIIQMHTQKENSVFFFLKEIF